MKRALLIMGTLLILWSAGFSLFLQHLQSFSSRDAHACDAVVVFTGKGHRIQTGYDLFRRSGARGFLVSGVEEGLDLEDLALKEATEKPVTLGYEAYNTHTNAIETALWAKKNQFKSLCLVTGLYHMPRSLLELQAVLPQVTLCPYAIKPPTSWWQDRKQFLYLLSEYHKFCLTHLIQWIVG